MSISRGMDEDVVHKSISLPLGLALGSPIFPSGCEGKLGVALESLQGLRDLTKACVRDLIFLSEEPGSQSCL